MEAIPKIGSGTVCAAIRAAGHALRTGEEMNAEAIREAIIATEGVGEDELVEVNHLANYLLSFGAMIRGDYDNIPYFSGGRWLVGKND